MCRPKGRRYIKHNQGSVVNPDTGMPVYIDTDGDGGDRLLAEDFQATTPSAVADSPPEPGGEPDEGAAADVHRPMASGRQ